MPLDVDHLIAHGLNEPPTLVGLEDLPGADEWIDYLQALRRIYSPSFAETMREAIPRHERLAELGNWDAGHYRLVVKRCRVDAALCDAVTAFFDAQGRADGQASREAFTAILDGLEALRTVEAEHDAWRPNSGH